MDYPCGKFNDGSFSRFGFIMQIADRQTYRITHTHTDADDRLTHVTPVDMSMNGCD